MTWNGWRLALGSVVLTCTIPLPLPLRHQGAALSDPNGWTLDSAEACKKTLMQCLCNSFFSAYLLTVNAAFIPRWRPPCYMLWKHKTKSRYVLCLFFFFFCHLDCWCIWGKCPFIYQGRAQHPPIYKFNSPSKLGLITTALGHNQHPWSNQGPALDRKGYFHK